MSKSILEFDLIVVGAGVFGLSTSIFLATHYPHIKFALVEQFRIGHGEGSSGSQLRISRTTYKNPFYKDLCVEGHNKYWPQMEKLFQDSFIITHPYLYFFEDHESFQNFQKVAETSNGQIQILPVEEVRKQFPTIPFIDTKLPVFHDTKAKLIFAEKYQKAITVYLRTYPNITILEETSIVSLDNSNGKVKMIANRQGQEIELHSKKVSLSCGRWIGKLIPLMNGIAHEARQTVSFWRMKQPESYAVGKFPCWIHRNATGVFHYGLPDAFGAGLKLCLHCPDSSLFNSFKTQVEYENYMVAEYMKTAEYYFKGKIQKLAKVDKCYYTNIKSQDFLIDWSDQHNNVLVVSPCSGHGFKFGPVIGKLVADILIKDQTIPVFEENRRFCRLSHHLSVNLK